MALLDPSVGSAPRTAIQRKSKNTTTTPDGLPDPVPPESIPPALGEDHVDAEGNKIEQHNGHWHLSYPPKALSFPIASGYKPELLPINPNASYTALRARVVAIQAEQIAYATSLKGDLPRAIAACFVTHYAGIPGVGLGDFKSDFDGMGPVFDKAQVSLIGEIKDDTWIIDPGRFGPVQDAGFPFIFNVRTEREHTFEKAAELSKAMRRGDSNADFTKKMRTLTRAAHPNSGADDFKVDGSDVGGQFNWMNQPGIAADRPAPPPSYESAAPPPPFPEKLFFKQGRGQGDDKLEQAIRDDQDLAPFKALAEWTRNVRGAEIYLEGHASAEGADVDNENLASSRAFLVKYFMWHCGADAEHNTFNDVGKGEAGATPTPEWRHVVVGVVKRSTGRQQHNTPSSNLPSEVAK